MRVGLFSPSDDCAEVFMVYSFFKLNQVGWVAVTPLHPDAFS